jgi:IclR family pca regulon transcriptional regulator
VGGRLPAYCTSMGRILLAALDDASLGEYLERVDLQPKTSRTLSTAPQLLACLHNVREQGWCIVDQELEQGLRSIAVPVYDASGQVLAALNVSTHAGRVSSNDLQQRVLPIMLSASRELSMQLFA